MSDQLNKIRIAAHEKLKKESEVVVEVEKPSALQTAAVDYLSRKEEPHPFGSPKNINEMKKVEITLNNPNDVKKIKKDVIDLTNKKRKVNITMKQMGKKLIIDGGDYDINREVADIRNFIGFKSAKVVESVNEGKMSQLHTYIKQGKTAKEIGKLMGVDPKTIQKLMDAYDAKNESVELDEIVPAIMAVGRVAAAGAAIGSQSKEQKLNAGKEKSVRQLINPTKEVMVVKKNKVVVIDKKDQDKYMKQGWALAEQIEQLNGTKGE